MSATASSDGEEGRFRAWRYDERERRGFAWMLIIAGALAALAGGKIWWSSRPTRLQTAREVEETVQVWEIASANDVLRGRALRKRYFGVDANSGQPPIRLYEDPQGRIVGAVIEVWDLAMLTSERAAALRFIRRWVPEVQECGERPGLRMNDAGSGRIRTGDRVVELIADGEACTMVVVRRPSW